MKIKDFSKAFKSGQKFDSKLGNMILNPYHIGDLLLISGELVACDPLVFPDTDPFFAKLPPNRYPVILSIAYNYNTGQYTNAFAMLHVSANPPVGWALVTKAGEEIHLLPDDRVFGYGVDSGIGCFMDKVAARAIVDSIWNTETYEDSLLYQIEESLEKNTNFICTVMNSVLDRYTEVNIIAFTSGIGDGFYPSYFGYDIENNIVNVVTPFLSGKFL
ncbi:DUF4241 domain-containing protein [Lusitaniella coriacea LEGE 07157]|uniref:DUF4241 domain-containing protein n=1 Tax=Lusitaniella coriacea LEGE 07157 TaxID=945747 RepID=A0A8J7DWY4_9CYAN|nr:DUF4241 domain-containing protein [Lusitaniella coriacea]MBE9116724.1 DUF4241 domain-containing protein [Lusitaniella coriacea LEGE 07157]